MVNCINPNMLFSVDRIEWKITIQRNQFENLHQSTNLWNLISWTELRSGILSEILKLNFKKIYIYLLQLIFNILSITVIYLYVPIYILNLIIWFYQQKKCVRHHMIISFLIFVHHCRLSANQFNTRNVIFIETRDYLESY